MKRRVALGFGFAALLLVVLLGFVGGRDVVAELSHANWPTLTVGVLSGLLALTFRGLVWSRFLRLVDPTLTRASVGSVFLTAMFLKYVTPYGQVATEPVVAYLVASRSEMAVEDGFAGVVSADLLNYVPYYTFGFLALVFMTTDDVLGNDMRAQLTAFGGLFVLVAALVYVVVRRESVVYRLVLPTTSILRSTVGRFTTRVDRALAPTAVRSRLDGFYETVDTITADRRTLVHATIYAHLGMAFLMAPVYVGAVALGHELPIAVVALAVALGKLGSVVPAPGGTGGVEAIVTASLVALGGLTPATALTVALIYRACTYWLTICVGGAFTAGSFARA
ncbi:flippase-like domain-containing protein [Halobacteria archaeon AArc-dxtr1]|nr:flippase-like domain-containing protein [Halobacteria archaeon AArc-dxtr1]